MTNEGPNVGHILGPHIKSVIHTHRPTENRIYGKQTNQILENQQTLKTVEFKLQIQGINTVSARTLVQVLCTCNNIKNHKFLNRQFRN